MVLVNICVGIAWKCHKYSILIWPKFRKQHSYWLTQLVFIRHFKILIIDQNFKMAITQIISVNMHKNQSIIIDFKVFRHLAKSKNTLQNRKENK